MASSNPPFNFYDAKLPIYTHVRYLPGSVIDNSRLKGVLLCDGCRIQKAEISHSVIGVRSQIATASKIKESVIMGADYYEPGKRPSSIPIGIGPNCDIDGAILDKNVRLGEGVVIRPFTRGVDIDSADWFVRDGIVVIPKNAEIKAGTHITPDDVKS